MSSILDWIEFHCFSSDILLWIEENPIFSPWCGAGKWPLSRVQPLMGLQLTRLSKWFGASRVVARVRFLPSVGANVSLVKKKNEWMRHSQAIHLLIPCMNEALLWWIAQFHIFLQSFKLNCWYSLFDGIPMYFYMHGCPLRLEPYLGGEGMYQKSEKHVVLPNDPL